MAIDYNIIGSRIKKARIKRLTQLCGLLDVSEGYILNGSSRGSSQYLNREFIEILKTCSPEKQKMIYNVAKAIAESDK